VRFDEKLKRLQGFDKCPFSKRDKINKFHTFVILTVFAHQKQYTKHVQVKTEC
jgi:hypothetical protein